MGRQKLLAAAASSSTPPSNREYDREAGEEGECSRPPASSRCPPRQPGQVGAVGIPKRVCFPVLIA